MSEPIATGQLKDLQRYVPPGWEECIERPLAPDNLTTCVSHLQVLLGSVGTYLPRAVLVADPPMRVGQGEFHFGTALFADVSGFSTLTERFSQECGREGAEEVTLIVNRFLEVVNGIAIRHGGDLLKFAGDAALSFYQGQEHAARACRAAWEMQQAVRERFACVKTSLGEFPLRMSVGLGSGEAFLASLGEPGSAEYTVMGPALAAMGQAEHLAQAGQAFIDHATRELAGPAISVLPGGEEGFCELTGTEPRPSAVERPDLRLVSPEGSQQVRLHWLLERLDALTPYLPPGLLDKLLCAPAEASIESDHRWVTTIFADLRGANDLVETLGPRQSDLLTEVLNRYFLAMRRVVERYEGVLHKVGAGPTGPHLFITFGAPKSHPDDPERAVRTALEMQEALLEINREVEARIGDVPGLEQSPFRQTMGITTGFVFAGSIGSARRWEYTVMGDVVNLACRLMAAAADGEILVAESTAHHLSRRFELQPRPPMYVKGKREPVSYARAVGLSRLPPLLETAESVVVGRQGELMAAQALLDRALQGKGSVLTICGDAGMGKSRLAQEIAQQAQQRGMDVVAGACLSYGGDTPYLPWADVLRTLLGISAPERGVQLDQLTRGLRAAGLAGWEPLVADVLGLEAEGTELTASLDARLRQQRLFDIVLQLIQDGAQNEPLLLVIEDVHWSDPTSLELLDYVARNVASSAVIVLILHRPREWLEGRWRKLGHAVEIPLRELPRTALQGLIADLLHVEEVADQLVSLVLRKAQGNPFFTEEMLRALIEARVLQRLNAHWELVADPDQAGVPDTIHGVIQSRMDRLEETDRRVVQVASVIGRVFSLPVLGGVYPYSDLSGTLIERLGRLGTLGLVLMEMPEPELLYMFRHALTQDVAYESLPYTRRRELHRRVGTFVRAQGGETASERPEFLAHHFLEGHAWPEALDYSLAAGRKAQREYANEVAITHFTRALRAAAELEEPGAEELLEAHERLGEVLTIAGRYDEALRHLEEARGLVEGWPPSPERDRKLAGLYGKTAAVYEAKGNYDTALEQLAQGLALPTVGQLIEGARLYLRGVSIFHRQADYFRAEEWCQRGLEIAEQVRGREGQQVMARGYYLLGGVLTRRGDLDNAVAYCMRSLALCQDLGNLFGQAQAHNNLAMAYDDQDMWDLAAEHYVAARDIVQQIGYAEGQARAASNLGEVYLSQGQLDQARAQYTLALEIVERLGMTYGVALLHNNLGAVLARDGEWDAAMRHLQQSLRLFQEIGSEEFLAELLRHCAEVALGQEQPEIALAHAEHSLRYAQVHNMQLEEGITWRVLGRVYRKQGKLVRAEEALMQALEIAQETHKRHETALIHLELAQLRMQQNREKEGKTLAQRAAQVFEELGARLDLEKAKGLTGSSQQAVAGEEG